MDRFFKRNHTKKRDRSSDHDSSNRSSGIDEEIDITPVRPDKLQPSNSWPRLPELALTTSGESHVLKPVDVPQSPALSTVSSSQAILHPGINRQSAAYTSTDNEVVTTDTESESDTINIGHHRHHHHQDSPSFDDSNSTSRTMSKLAPLNNDHHEAGFGLGDSAANTLVEAALDKDEAKDRHVRFHDHVAESAALVQRMLSVKMGHHHTPDPLGTMMQNRHDQHQLEEEFELQSPHSTAVGGGSVLASLMKLEAKRQDSTTKKKRRKSKNTLHMKRKKNRSSSLLNYPVHSNTDPLSENSGHTLPTPRPQRPPLVNRPSSWLAGVASSKYVVPSLEKRKKSVAPSFSRRSSNDSMLTTASQFEPITLEDRIRITFEIANILQKQEFLRKLCKSLMLYGCPAHRLEYAMRQVSRTLAVDAEYVFIPNVMLVTFIDSTTHTTETHFIRQSQTFEMHRLADIYRLEKLVAHGEVSVDEALEFIDKVYDQPPIYPLWLHPFVYALAAFSGCVLFYGGRWQEAGVAAALGMVFASNEIFSAAISSFQPIWEITVCILIGFVARGIQKFGFCFTPIAFSSFIIVLPGYPMAVAIIELVSRQLVSGVVRMVYAIIYSFLLGYGVSMGSELYMTMDKNATTTQSDVCKLASSAATCISSESQWFNFLMVPLFATAYCVYLRARPPRWPIMAAVSACGYVINYSLACWGHAPSQILQVVPSFGLGLIGNCLSKFTGKMSFDAVLLGVFYLVPSSLGLKAAIGLFSGTDEVGTQGAGFALAMIESSIGITLGLFLATLIVYPKGTQHTPLMNL
ncbi:pheromone-regulated protein prm10 [Mucor circinelloides]